MKQINNHDYTTKQYIQRKNLASINNGQNENIETSKFDNRAELFEKAIKLSQRE